MFHRLGEQVTTTAILGALVIAGAMLSYRNLSQMASSQQSVERTWSVLNQIEVVSSDLNRTVSASRAFALSSQPEYLQKCEHWAARTSSDIDGLQLLLSDDPNQLADLNKLRSANAQVLAQVELAANSRDRGQLLHAGDELTKSQAAIDQVRAVIAELRDREQVLLRSRSESARRATSFGENGVVAAAFVDLLLFGVWGVLVLKDVANRHRSQVRTNLQTIADCSDDAIIGCDPSGFISNWNHGAERVFGYTATEIEGMRISILSDENRNSELTEIIRRVMTGDRVEHFETTALTKDGDAIHIVLTASQVRDANATPGRVLLIARDITAQKLAENKLRQTGEQYRLIFDGNPLPMWVADRKTLKFLDVNEAAIRNYGYSREEFLGMTILDIRPPKDIPAVLETMAEPLVGLSETKCWTHLKKDGTPITVEITRHHLQFNNSDAELVLANDVTERNRNEEKLRSSEERFSKAFRLSPVAITISTRSENTYLDVNDAFLELTGYTREQVIGHTGFELNIWGQDDRERLIKTLSESGRAAGFELLIKTAANQPKTVQVSADLINLNGEQCILAITYDITKRRELEHQLRQAQKMEAVGRLAGGVAHDFNNMLGVITGYTDLIRARFEKDEVATNQVDEIRKASDRAVSLTRQLLAFSRKQVLQPKSLNLNERIRDLGKMLQRLMGDDIELIVRPGEPLDLVKADPGQIDQVIVNLAVNARDAMPCGGRFIIETSCVELNAGNIPHQHRAKPGRYVLIKISDTGHGMDAETLSHIFEPFFTTKQPGKGTGLGLSTVHGIVNQSDGYIWVYSEPSRGSTFKVYLPAISQPASVMPTKAPVPALARGSGTILLAEDDAPMRALTRHLLEIQGYRVLEADDGDAAVRLAEAHCDEIQLLLTDVVMPRLSGPSLAERVRTLNPNIKTIYMSGYTDELLAHHGAIHSGITFLEKPFTQESLMRVVQGTLSCADGSETSALAAHGG